MYITHTDYVALGYVIVPESEFGRYEAMAEATVRRYTQNRIATMQPPADASDEDKRVCEMNRRGMCEIIDIYYTANNPQSDAAKARQVITGYHNGDYGESYLGEARSDVGAAAPERMDISAILSCYFTPDQLYRGVS